MTRVSIDLPESVTERVLTEVARCEGVEPTELDQPLYEVIDPDALEVVFGSPSVWVTFTYCGYKVTVNGPDAVTVDPLAPC